MRLLARKAKDEGKPVPFRIWPHLLRHTAATGLASLGFGRDLIAKVLNRKSADRTVTAVYDRYDALEEKRTAP